MIKNTINGIVNGMDDNDKAFVIIPDMDLDNIDKSTFLLIHAPSKEQAIKHYLDSEYECLNSWEVDDNIFDDFCQAIRDFTYPENPIFNLPPIVELANTMYLEFLCSKTDSQDNYCKDILSTYKKACYYQHSKGGQ